MKACQETYIIWNWKAVGRLTFNICILKKPYTHIDIWYKRLHTGKQIVKDISYKKWNFVWDYSRDGSSYVWNNIVLHCLQHIDSTINSQNIDIFLLRCSEWMQKMTKVILHYYYDGRGTFPITCASDFHVLRHFFNHTFRVPTSFRLFCVW